MKSTVISSLILLLALISPVVAVTHHVPSEYPTIQSAIQDSNESDTIIVSEGIYLENINFLGKNIAVISTDPENPDIVANTIIDGNNVASVVTFAAGENRNALLSGFTIKGGYGTLDTQLISNIFWGGGIFCCNASPVIEKNIIINNNSPIDTESGSFASYGGGIGCYNSNAIITRNIIKNNSAAVGGGILTISGNPTICNNIISSNSAYMGGGAAMLGGELINNTITGNNASIVLEEGSSGSGGNVFAENMSGMSLSRIINNIISNAESGSGLYLYGDWDSFTFGYNNVWGNLPANYDEQNVTDMTGIYGNISEDPLLADDYHIGTDSPCYNAGDPNYMPFSWQRDIDGQYAVMGACVDVGADEVTDNARPVADAGDGQHFNTIVANVVLDGTTSYDPDNSGALTYQWRQISGPNVVLSNPDTPEPNFAPPAESVYIFELIVFDGNLYSQPDSVTILVGNQAPVADAGEKQVCEPGKQVILNGSNSYDPDAGDVLSYKWTQVSGPAAELSDPNASMPQFTPDIIGEYVFELIVSDGAASSAPDSVTIVCRVGSEPDAYGYSWIDSDNKWGPPFHWIDITNSRTKITGIENSLAESFGPISLGFNFNFYGKTYNSCYIQSEGLISFGSDPITYNNEPVPQIDEYNNLIAWMWMLHYPQDNSEIYYRSFGDYFVIQFVDYTIYSNDGIVNAEVILYKSGKIIIQYKDFSANAYLYSTVGIENSDGTIGTQVAYNTSNYLHDELAIEFSLGGPYMPVAHAGPDQQYKTTQLVTLDGTGSNDRDPNDVLTYQWTQTGGPSVELSDSTAAKPTFTPETEGSYFFELVVSDGTFTSYPDEVMAFIGNRPPIANAGQNKACEPNQVIYLDGSGSYDLDTNDVLSYSWTQVSGPAVNISNADKKIASFTPTTRGEYIFELTVSDGIDQSQPDNVIIACGMGSAPDEFGYHWIDNNGTWGPQFRWIDIQETGTQVSDITYSYQESFGPFPMGFDFNFYGNVYDYFYIQASGSISFGSEAVTYNNRTIPQADGYNNLIAWFWTLLYPQGKSKLYYQHFDGYTVIQFVDYDINYGGNVNAEVIIYESGKIAFIYKDFSEDAYLNQYTIGIENADGTIGTQVAYNQQNFLHDGLVIELTSGPYLPVAQAGENQYISKPELVTLDGSKSYTYGQAQLAYHWRQIEGPEVTLSDANSVNPTFLPEPESQYRFELVVSDNMYQSEPDEVLIVVHNMPPVANAGLNQLIKTMPLVITLNGTGSYDPFDDSLLYNWTQISGPAVTLSNPNAVEPNFVPTEYGVYEFELVVNDGQFDSNPDNVTIILDNGFFPVADAGLPVYTDGRAVSLNGKRSYDPDHLPGELIYSWTQISGPPATLSGADTSAPVISGVHQTSSIQICEFQLIVYDGEYFSFPDTVELRVIPTHPADTFELQSGTFDPNKPTVVYFNGGDGVYGSGSWPYTTDWTSKANCLCFTNYGPDSSTSGARTYYHCGDMLILYLSQVAPNYNQAIQTMGWSTGGQPSMDTGIRMNLTYKDRRYAVNRITLLDECCRDFTQDIADFMENPVDGEQSWVDEYFGYMGNSYPGALYAHVADGDHGAPPTWYKNSLSNPDMNVFNDGIIAGAYWSVIGPGKNFQLSRTHINDEIYQFLWHGSTTDGYMSFYNESLYPGRMLGLFTLADPYEGDDPNGVILSCQECENAVGYEVLIGTDPNHVTNFKVVGDSTNLPECLITSLPAEKSWWTVRARDAYGSTIFADPVPITSFMMSLPVQNLTTGKRYCTIRDAVDKAASGDEILVNPGVYNESIICSQKNITIRSANPNDPAVTAQTIISGIAGGTAITFTGAIDSTCVLEGFTIEGAGNGIYCEEFASPTISKCIIAGNSDDGIYLFRGCEPVISECAISKNGNCGIRMKTLVQRVTYYNKPVITNCIIAGNTQYGISEGKPTILNCTIADNLQGGIYNSTAVVTNSIIYFNKDGSASAQVIGNKSSITFCDVQGSWPGTGNIASDPLFADHANNDYHLKSQTGRWDPVNSIWIQDDQNSPCIDAGDPASDIGLEPAPNGSVINMGAYGGTTSASKSQ